MDDDHDRALSEAFDHQAPRFERAPVQSDPVAIERLVRFSAFKPGGSVLDAGCGPGLVTTGLLAAGYRVVGVDLSREMIDRARRRCAGWKDQSEFQQASVFDPALDCLAPFDGALSRYVVHHVVDPLAFVARRAALLGPGGILVVCDHVTDPDPDRARHHEAIERARDRTHTSNLTSGQLVDLFCRAGLGEVQIAEEAFELDFDEWFDRGSSQDSKEHVRAMLLEGPSIRGFRPTVQPDGSVRVAGLRGLVRGVKPQVGSS
jgi:SAM-dependent methyltransferase